MVFKEIIAIDLETTGFSSSKDEILEFGAVAKRQNTLRYFNRLVQIEKPIPDKIIQLTGIDEKTLIDEKAQPLKICLEEFIKFIFLNTKFPLLVGHNIKRFDLKFLKASLARERMRCLSRLHVWDTMTNHRKDKALKRKNGAKSDLGSTCSFYGISNYDASHRAGPDALRALTIYEKQRNNRKLSYEIL